MPGGQGTADINPRPASISGNFIPVLVARYLYRGPAGDEQAGGPYELLPNVRCLQIDQREGAEPPVARFQYVMDDYLRTNLGWPSQFEQLWPIDAKGDYLVKADDELVVMTLNPDGDPIILFWGFAQVPQVDVADSRQSVTFTAIGVAIRMWDTPITFRWQRRAHLGDLTDGTADIKVQLPTRFNPANHSIGVLGGYTPNCVGTDFFTSGTDEEDPDVTGDYPVFIDPTVRFKQPTFVSYWFLSDAMKYLCFAHQSPEDPTGFPYVVYPTFDSLDEVLGCKPPIDGDIIGPGKVETDKINIRDYDASNKPVGDVMAELLNYGGFSMSFAIETDTDHKPVCKLVIRRRDALSTAQPKLLYLAASGASTLNLAANNATALHLGRDCNAIVNEIDIETGVKQVEVTVYLVPLFTPTSGDGTTADKLKRFLLPSLEGISSTDEARRMYRWYGADECGEGHWNSDTSSFVTDTPIDLSRIFPTGEEDEATYVERFRPGQMALNSKDVSGKPLRALLECCLEIPSRDPKLRGINDITGTWFPVPDGWNLLHDRLGIEVAIVNPEEWSTGNKKLGAAGKINGVSWVADPDVPDKRSLNFRLTTVIDSDVRIEGVTAAKRVSSPTKYKRARSSDGKDHFQYCTIDTSSTNYSTQKDKDGNPGNDTDPLIVRDDTDAAKTHAEQLRAANEFPRVAGAATIPYWTDYYRIADQVRIVQGRNASFQINVGADQGEAPCYPWVTAVTWIFETDRQETILQLSDRRAEPRNL